MRRAAFLVVLALASCTSAPVATRAPAVVPSVRPVLGFSVPNVLKTIGDLATGIGPRESVTPSFRRAIAYMRARIEGIGDGARVISVPVPAGRVRGTPEPAGTTYDVVGEPPGYRPARPHLVVCGHLDTVPFSPGANDNASGVAVALELARLANATHFKLPVVFVAFGAEESIVQHPGVLAPKYGSRAYIASLSQAERDSILGVFNLDMIGAGPIVHLGNRGPVLDAAFRTARAMGMKVALEVSALSDHTSFEAAGIPVVWFWSGPHPSFHTPGDTVGVIQRAEIARDGALAWATMRALAS